MPRAKKGSVWIHRRMRDIWLRYENRWRLVELFVVGTGETHEYWIKRRLYVVVVREPWIYDVPDDLGDGFRQASESGLDRFEAELGSPHGCTIIALSKRKRSQGLPWQAKAQKHA